MTNNIYKDEGTGVRLRQLRKALGLTQIEFANRLKLSNGHISDMEKGRKNITDPVIKLITLEFNVNENWLRSGDGGDSAMFNTQNNDEKLSSALEKVLSNDDDFIKRTMLALAELDKSQLDAIKTLVNKISSINFHSDSNIPVVNTENKEVLKHEVAMVEAEQQATHSKTSASDIKHA